jgi:hypothetical protein
LERQATSAHTIAKIQQGLAAAYNELAGIAEQMGDHVGEESNLRKCHQVLHDMKLRGLSFDHPQIEEAYQNLHARFA